MKSRYKRDNVSRSFMLSELQKYFGDKVKEYGIKDLDISVGEYFELMRILNNCLENVVKNPEEFDSKLKDLSIFTEKDLAYIIEQFPDGFCSNGGFVTPGAYFLKGCKPDYDANFYGILTLVAANDIYNNKLCIPRNGNKRKIEKYSSHSVLIMGKYVFDTLYSQTEMLYIVDYLDMLYKYNNTIKIFNKSSYYTPIDDKYSLNETQFKMFTMNYNGCTVEEFHNAASNVVYEDYFSEILFKYKLSRQSTTSTGYSIPYFKKPDVRKITIF